MRRRRLLLVVGAVGLLGVAGFVSVHWLTTPTPGVTWENFRRLKKGMSLSDVIALLGQPHQTIKLQTWGNPGEAVTTRCWRHPEVAINLTFDAGEMLMYGMAFPQGDMVNHVPHEYFPRADESFLDHIRRWLHW